MMQSHKVVFVGDSSVGKTSIISQLIYNNSAQDQGPTVGIDFFSKNITVGTETIRVQIWDTAGQEQFHSLIPSYLRNSTIAIIVYDITNQESFENLDRWIKTVLDIANPAIIIVGNKSDLEDARAISTEDGQRFAEAHQAKFIETSARKPSNINELFQFVGEIPISNQISSNAADANVKIENESGGGGGCFC
ncbi:Ras family protein [Tritrichomonas foetus]|uniref:Ras family protein n=1 Tax=Tritrichomonas foetus TaxID=1144522 RepID=A0A1J4JAM7_9EUKA|nr:Ras family protein [Tritrichomonas foetus]|eukprot:OHS96230.1 Ras family protein [Tritrichomonas foetus]